jgi:hypothetical protein
MVDIVPAVRLFEEVTMACIVRSEVAVAVPTRVS